MSPKETVPGVSGKTPGTDDELTAVFGPGDGGLDPVQRAESSTRVFVRSHGDLAIHADGATGLALSPSEALAAFGWEALRGLADKPTVGIVTRGNDASTVQRKRRLEIGLSLNGLASAAGVSVEDAQAVEDGRRRVPMSVLAPLALAMGLCPIRFGAVPCRKAA